MDRPAGLQTETVRSAMERADSVSRPDGKSYSGVMCRNKDLRHIVLMVKEYRTLIAEVERMTATVEKLRISRQEEIDRYINECNHADKLERDRKAEVERLTGENQRLSESLDMIAANSTDHWARDIAAEKM